VNRKKKSERKMKEKFGLWREEARRRRRRRRRRRLYDKGKEEVKSLFFHLWKWKCNFECECKCTPLSFLYAKYK
jgi:hypothetical protein